ncbi:MAG: rod shape-determining protein MreD [Clostridia bacterium]|nr:rod shape-determining protein MreD [Clostridia bacterium]
MKTRRSIGTFWLKNYISWIVYGLSAVLMVLVQNAPHLFPTLWHARPVPIVLFVVCVAVLEGARIGAVVGLGAGLLWDIYAFHLFGFNALILLAVGLTVGVLVEWLLRANFLSSMLLCGGALLAQALLEWFFCYVIFGREGVWHILWKVYLPNAVYTALLAPAMYYLVLWIARFIRRRQGR